MMPPHHPDLERAAQALMDVEEICIGKGELLEQMHEEQQVSDKQSLEKDIQEAQSCLEDFMKDHPVDDPRLPGILDLSDQLDLVKDALKRFDLRTAGRLSGEVARVLHKMLSA